MPHYSQQVPVRSQCNCRAWQAHHKCLKPCVQVAMGVIAEMAKVLGEFSTLAVCQDKAWERAQLLMTPWMIPCGPLAFQASTFSSHSSCLIIGN